MNIGCYISILILNGCVCIVTSIHVCSNQTEFGKTVYLSRDERDVTQCQCDVSLPEYSKKDSYNIGFHRQWFSNSCEFNFFVTENSIRRNYSCKDFKEQYFTLNPGNVLTIALESNSDADLFDFNLVVHSYTDNSTLILECYELLNTGVPGVTGQTTLGTSISTSPADDGNGDTGLGAGAIVGIVIGVILLILIIIIIIVCLVKKKREETYANTARHDHDLHIYQSVTSDTTNATRITYDNTGMVSDNGVPELPIQDFTPARGDVNSNKHYDNENRNLETVIDSSSIPDTRNIENNQPNIVSSPQTRDVDADFSLTHIKRAPDNDTEVNLQGEQPTIFGDDDIENYSEVTRLESSQI
ncbi:hypothetical protein LOTGIDRAFT_169893 [Lottia gigantea]|uniref:CUB domain-containing protein n=1 Tax=Lottia gigantea TaxID=225164 RepID=V3YWY9_LOTGI|nr:hypothetical protein LOTGIDRAFT_169893 [Lottia gigantea]ESO82573.1 hypothetical protein LOTGIDRAFT_169893 [Lottia gigantea]